jgi:hypothetical protein
LIAFGGRRGCWAAVACAAVLLSAWGCNAVTGSTGYYVVQASLPDSGPASLPDSGPTSHPQDEPQDACIAGTDRSSLERACTNSVCVPFSTVLPSCEGGVCPLPVASPPAAVDGGDAEAASVPDGGPADSAPSASAEAGADATPEAGALPSCSQVGVNASAPVYVTGSTALASFIGEVSSALASTVTVVYQGSGSCVGVHSVLDPADYPLSSANGTATYYAPGGQQKTCQYVPTEGLVADVGASDVFYSTCYLGLPLTPPIPASVAENFGPVQVMNFAVPQPSTQQSISLAAAYYVFGFGGQIHAVPPWTDPAQLQIRSANSGTQSLIAAAIGVPAAQWYGVNHSTSAQVGAALVAAGQSGNQTTIDSALGILASDYLLQNSQSLRGLALQDTTAGCGYYPNSTAFAHDDVNARDGHYPLWGPSHFYARVDPATNLPLKPGVSQFIDGLNGLTALPGLDLVAEYSSKGLIPECAMHVTRTSDGADYTPYKAPVACNCYFELHATGSTTCPTCRTNSDCPARAPSCNKFGPQPQQGYCDL